MRSRSHHAPIAAKVGVPAKVIDEISQGRRPTFDDDELKCVFDVAVELHRDKAISDATFETAIACLGTTRLVDLVGLCGYYTLISMTINAFEVPVENGARLPKIDLKPHEMFR